MFYYDLRDVDLITRHTVRCCWSGRPGSVYGGLRHNTWEPRENVLDDRLFEEFQRQKQKNKKRSSSGSVSKKSETTTPPTKKPRRLAGGDIRDESSESSEHDDELGSPSTSTVAKGEKESDVDQSFVSDERSEIADMPSEREEPRSEETEDAAAPAATAEHAASAKVGNFPVMTFIGLNGVRTSDHCEKGRLAAQSFGDLDSLFGQGDSPKGKVGSSGDKKRANAEAQDEPETAESNEKDDEKDEEKDEDSANESSQAAAGDQRMLRQLTEQDYLMFFKVFFSSKKELLLRIQGQVESDWLFCVAANVQRFVTGHVTSVMEPGKDGTLKEKAFIAGGTSQTDGLQQIQLCENDEKRLRIEAIKNEIRSETISWTNPERPSEPFQYHGSITITDVTVNGQTCQFIEL
ncbi:unnamed protein product [Nippostrongylus brasiliensis]|uniref:Chromo domain-containing protein n=1 Tax=Nippostrongylus brasiliensis TaxID=27835 RepID=A0A158QZB6_NIPBR|nr:unnamed protein product [Nippostrongylus brasiliensis]